MKRRMRAGYFVRNAAAVWGRVEERSADDSDLADLSEIEREIDALVGEQEAEEAAYARDLKRAYISLSAGQVCGSGRDSTTGSSPRIRTT